jgi:hypothetical protein
METSIRRHIYAAFDQGIAPMIACINRATVPLGVDFSPLIEALQAFVTHDFAPVWGTPAQLVISDTEMPGAWSLVFTDDADAANALGYHELTADGYPVSRVFVKTTLAGGEAVSVTAAHEIAEMLLDPAINMWAEDANGLLYAVEASDAVETETYLIGGIAVSDFVYPSYFESFHAPGSRKFDHLGLISRPFEVLPGGYSIVRDEKGIRQIYGSRAAEDRIQKEDRRGHRSQYRGTVLDKRSDVE